MNDSRDQEVTMDVRIIDRADATEDKFSVRVVFDIESNPPEPIGTYSGMIEDTVCYFSPVGQRVRYAPADCVLVVSVDLYPRLRAQAEGRRSA
jgi:hypothetical protein